MIWDILLTLTTAMLNNIIVNHHAENNYLKTGLLWVHYSLVCGPSYLMCINMPNLLNAKHYYT